MRDKDYQVEVDGDLVTLEQLKSAYRFWKHNHWEKDDDCCPICGTDFNETGLFVCSRCGELLDIGYESPYEANVCIDCDERHQKEKAYEDAYNHKIDIMRGK